MEDKVEEVLGRSLLPCDSKVALLKAFEVVHAIFSEEIETELDTLYLFDDKFDDLQRVALLVDLLNDVRLLDQDRVDELHKLVLKGESLLA